MAKELTLPTKTALIANTDLEAGLHFRNPDDPSNVVIGDMKFDLHIATTDGTGGRATVKVTDHLSGQALTDFRSALTTLRDACFAAAGYVDV